MTNSNGYKLAALKTPKLLTAEQVAARLARGAVERTRRAEMRALVGNEMGLGGSDYRVVAEAYRRLAARSLIGASEHNRGRQPPYVVR